MPASASRPARAARLALLLGATLLAGCAKRDANSFVVGFSQMESDNPWRLAETKSLKDEAAKRGITTFMLAPQSGADINGQMGMIQDVINQKVAAIILSTHDEHAAAPLIKQAVAQGIAVIIVNSDIANFPTPVHAVVGYSQRNGTRKEGEYALKLTAGKPMKVGVLEGQPGYHSTERVGGNRLLPPIWS